MTQQFTLDTSGYVYLPGPEDAERHCVWEDLSPFAQGYVEALFTGPATWTKNGELRSLTVLMEWAGFSDLHPESLAMILRDCEAIRAVDTGWTEQGAGRQFWHDRQGRLFRRSATRKRFPPLRVYLDDAGKVRLEVAQ